MATETTRAPTGLRQLFLATKTAIAETRDPPAVLKALIPMLREHAAEMKVKAKAAKSAPVKATRKTPTKPRKAAAPTPVLEGKPVVRRARKVAEAAA